MTNEHLRLLLDEEDDCRLLHGAAVLLAQANVPEEASAGIRVGRMVALRKPNGRVRAFVVGDVFRRLVGWVLAQYVAFTCMKRVCPSNLASARGAARRLSAVSSALLPKLTRTPRSCRSTRSVPLTTFPGRPCWVRWLPTLRCSPFYRMPPSSMQSPAHTLGMMTLVLRTRSCRRKAVNRVTPLCPLCIPSLSTQHLPIRKPCCRKQAKPFLRSWTTSTSSPPLSVSGLSLPPFKLLCGSTPAYSCTPANPGFGTQQARNPQTSPTLSAIPRILSGLGFGPPPPTSKG